MIALLAYLIIGFIVAWLLPWPEPPDNSEEEVLMWLDW